MRTKRVCVCDGNLLAAIPPAGRPCSRTHTDVSQQASQPQHCTVWGVGSGIGYCTGRGLVAWSRA
eukprot:2909710-Rhodomonas_salina.1